MADLTSANKIKRILGIPAANTMQDVYLGELADAVDGLMLEYCGVAALTAVTGLTQTFDIDDGQTEIMLGSFPVSGVDSVVDSGATMAESAWYLESRTGAVRLTGSGSFFTAGKQTVVVTYDAGYSAGPRLNALVHAAGVWAVALFNAGRHAGMRSEGVSGYRYTLDEHGVPAPVRAMLSPFVRVFPRGSEA